MNFGMFSPVHASVWDHASRGRGCSTHSSLARSAAAQILLPLPLALLKHCSRFMVDREETGADGVLYLKLADGRGGSDIVRWLEMARVCKINFCCTWNRVCEILRAVKPNSWILLASKCCHCRFFAAFDHSHPQMPCSRKKVGCSIRSPTGVLFVHHVRSARQGHLGNDHPNEWELRSIYIWILFLL